MAKAGGYHLRDIPKGTLGELSKVREELEEAEDAAEQGVRIMLLVELSDLYGALDAVARANGVSMDDLRDMHTVTKRAFDSGSRTTPRRVVGEWVATRDIVLSGSRRGIIRAGARFTLLEGATNALVSADRWDGRPAGDLLLVSFDPNDMDWWTEQGLIALGAPNT